LLSLVSYASAAFTSSIPCGVSQILSNVSARWIGSPGNRQIKN
jgi:hypothetical protein